MDNNTENNIIKKELQNYLIGIKDFDYLNKEEIETYGCGINSCYIYKNLFKHPVKRIFEWIEDDFQGTVYVLFEYTYNNKIYYISIKGRFGSCPGCDYIEGTADINTLLFKINNIFERIDICNDINDIVLSKYDHCDLQMKLYEFLNQI
jgi:hypothetical protein